MGFKNSEFYLLIFSMHYVPYNKNLKEYSQDLTNQGYLAITFFFACL